MRRVPNFKEDYRPSLKANLKILEREYRLLTPLFGGGVEPKYADPVSAVRTTEVKGQLRFWWRAARAGGLSLESMQQREAKLFGAAAGSDGVPSPLILELEALELGQEKHPFYQEPGKSFPRSRAEVAPGYIAFPLQANNLDPINYPVRVGIRFRLRLSFPESIQAEIEAALWAWERFGGLGGRTRRGFGAIALEKAVAPDEQAIEGEWGQYVRPGQPPSGVPSLSGGYWKVVERSWQQVAKAYQEFRQSRHQGQQSSSPGRSHWPEPDAIRNILRRAEPKHRHPILNPPILKFPRAQFGLPIIVHFKDKGDPSTQIIPANKDIERLASPLLFRPLDEKHCIVVILNTERTPPGGVALENGKRVETQPSEEDAQRIKPLQGEVDPLWAFMKGL